MPDLRGALLVRVDDRLLHGQVALGWRQALDPRAFWIVDDEVAGDPFARSLYEAALPEGTSLRVLREHELAPAWAELSAGTVLLVRSLAVLRRLCEDGFEPAEVNLGGLHARPGAQRVLDYLFLTEEDRATIRWLLDRGIAVHAQDLPSSRRIDGEAIQAAEGA